MDRRQMIAGGALAAVGIAQGQGGGRPNRHFLELKTWRLHTSDENQGRRVADYLEHGLFPALQRAGARPVAALEQFDWAGWALHHDGDAVRLAWCDGGCACEAGSGCGA